MGKRLILPVLLTVLSVFLVQDIASAALYRWIDKSGRSHVTDYPPPNEEDTEAKEPEKPEAAPDAKTKPAEPVSKATPSPVTPLPVVKTTPPPVTAVTPSPHAAAQPPVATAAPVPVQPSVTPAPKPTARTLPKPKMQSPETGMPLPKNLPFNPKTLLLIVFGIIGFIVLGFIFHSYYFYKIAARLDVPMPWMAWIPILNLYTKVQAADKPLWWILIIFVLPILEVVPWMSICERLGINKKYGLLSLSILIGPVVMALGGVFSSLFPGTLSIVILVIAMVLFALSLLAVLAQPAICYWAANKAGRTDFSYVPMGQSTSSPDYEQDTVPLAKPNYEEAGSGASAPIAAGVAAGAALGAGLLVGKDAYAHNTDDEETVGIQHYGDIEGFNENIHSGIRPGISLDEEHGTADSEALTIDPDAFTLDPEAVTIEPDAITMEPDAFTVDPDAVTIDPEAITMEPDAFSVDSEAFTVDAVALKSGIDEPPAASPDDITVDYGKDGDIDFSIDDITLDGVPVDKEDISILSHPEQDGGYKFDIDSMSDIQLSNDMPEAETRQEAMPEFKFQLEVDDLPDSDSGNYDLKESEHLLDSDIQLEREEFPSELSVSSDHSLELEIEDGGAISADFSAIDEALSETIESTAAAEEGEFQLPAEFSLEIAGVSSELPEMVLELSPEDSAEPVLNIPAELELDHPMEDEAGNLKIDTSDFKSLSALVDMEIAQETGGTTGQVYEISLEPEPEAAPIVQPKPKKGAKSKKEAVPETPEALKQQEPDLAPEVQPKSKKGAKSKKDARPEIMFIPEVPDIPELPAEPELVVKPAMPPKPVAPPKPDSERTIEDILIAGLKLELDETHNIDDGHKEEKP
ncbi:MAG: hypothetical protein H7843_02820 [Nitrospirota bacterium]